MNWRYKNDHLYRERRELASLTSEGFAKCVYPPPPPGDYIIWEGSVLIPDDRGGTYTLTFKLSPQNLWYGVDDADV